MSLVTKTIKKIQESNDIVEQPTVMGALRDPQFYKDMLGYAKRLPSDIASTNKIGAAKAAGRGFIDTIPGAQLASSGAQTLAKKLMGKQTSFTKEYDQETEKNVKAKKEFPRSYNAGELSAYVPAIGGLAKAGYAGVKSIASTPGTVNKVKSMLKGTGSFAKAVAKGTATAALGGGATSATAAGVGSTLKRK